MAEVAKNQPIDGDGRTSTLTQSLPIGDNAGTLGGIALAMKGGRLADA